MQNFLTSRKKVSGETVPPHAVVMPHTNQGISNVELVNGSAQEPKIELMTEGGIIRTIVINCKCGERIELKCHY